MIATELRMLPNGFVRCDAGCDEIGEHNDRPCLTCGGLGYHRNPKTSACPTVPPTGRADTRRSERHPRCLPAAGPKTPRQGEVTRLDSIALPGTNQETTQ